MVYMTLCKLYEKVDDCIICEERAEQLNKSLTMMPEHITENIMMFAGCKRREKELEFIELSDEIKKLKKQRGSRDLRMKLERKGDRLCDDMEKIMDEYYMSK